MKNQNLQDIKEPIENVTSEATQPASKSIFSNKTFLTVLFSAVLLGAFLGSSFVFLYTGNDDATTEESETTNPIENEESAIVDEKNEKVEDSVDNIKLVENVVVDTNQIKCYDSSKEVNCGSAFVGQDGEYDGNQPRYKDNGDGTVSDLVTELMWTQDPGEKQSYAEAVSNVNSVDIGRYTDWRVPSIKELYSLMDFSGIDPIVESNNASGLIPFIDDSVFDFEYGDTSNGERIIDSQWVTSTVYVSDVMNGQECFFGVNFADGRIKCYPTQNRGSGYFAIYVRGEVYGENDFVDNDDETITDRSTSLMWQMEDSGEGMNWEDALGYCEDSTLGEYSDWRLPNAKELQYIVDYTRSPDTSNSPALNSIFQTTEIMNEAGDEDYPFFWTGTTHVKSSGAGTHAVYVSFGRALGFFNNAWVDVHGAGAQRSDPKSGDIDDYPSYFGPQGDVSRLHNYVRCVRDVEAKNNI